MRKILVLEDDSSIRTELTELLKLKGYDAEGAPDAAGAIGMIESGRVYDMYLLDVMLPDGNGFDVCRYIRSRSDRPIIFLTSVDDEDSISKGLDIGGDDYIVKPFRMKELISRIQANLRRVEADKPKKDMAELLMPMGLTATERHLMEILCNNRGLIVKREALLNQLWDSHNNYVEDNTLTVVISRLKAKLKDAGSAAEIQTIKGVGYRLM